MHRPNSKFPATRLRAARLGSAALLGAAGLLVSALTGCNQECFDNCPDERLQVCSIEGVTYFNACFAQCSGTAIDYTGACTDEEDPNQG